MNTEKISISNLLILALAALLMRVIVGEVLRPVSHYDGTTGDYLHAAENIAEHGVLSRSDGVNPKPDSMRPPLYPMFLAALRILSGPTQWENWILSAQYLIGSLICVLIALLGALAGQCAGRADRGRAGGVLCRILLYFDCFFAR